MKLLLDTCALIWLATTPRKFSSRARFLHADPNNEVFLSAVSAWEIAVKHRKGTLRLPNGMAPCNFIPEARRRHGIDSLSLHENDLFMLDKLPNHHADPFDRMLICQAIANQMTILTPDPLITRYPVLTEW
ncbi:MAG: type II toxin-antitoxin system VapC family toxin [Rhodocyclaceae bacterium]|nr:type II toxin-antitoxin system VapC family toxin [Rhodocyclaceae bacterium]